MLEAVRKELLYNLRKSIEILELREDRDTEELKELSDHGISDVALYKDFDLISNTVIDRKSVV